MDLFVDRIISEGGTVSSLKKGAPKAAAKSTPASQHGRCVQVFAQHRLTVAALCPSHLTVSPSPCCSVHMKVSEKLSAVAGRDGGLDSFEVLGTSQQ